MAIDSIGRTQADTAGFIPIVWAQRALDVLRAKIVLAKVISRDTDYQPAWRGKTLNIPYPGTFTAQAKTEGNPATVQQPANSGTIPVTLDQYKMVDFLIEDIAQASANTNLMDRYVNPAMVALAEDLESYLMGLAPNLTGGYAGTTGTNMARATITAAMVALDESRVPSEDRSLIISPKDKGALLNDPALQNYFAFAQRQGVTDGSIGDIDGFRIFPSQLVPTQAGTSYQVVVVGTGGTFTLTFNGDATAAIAYNASAAAIQAALQAIASVGAGNAYVTGGTGTFLVTLTGSLSGDTSHAITGTSSLTGTSAGITVTGSELKATRNLAIHKDAMLLATRPLSTPPENAGVNSEVAIDPASGLAIRMSYQYSMDYRGVRVGFDILYGAVSLRPGNGAVVLS